MIVSWQRPPLRCRLLGGQDNPQDLINISIPASIREKAKLSLDQQTHH
jgi:hypothetical protein